MSNYVLKGNICYSINKNELETIDGYLVCENGKCAGVFKEIPYKYSNFELKDYSDYLIIPGMVDLHIHAPQYAFRGLGFDFELLDWLNNEAFKEESKYRDDEYASKAYSIFVDNIRKSATTRLSIFSSRHVKASEILMDKLEESGLVSYVGKVNMDRNAPEILVEHNSYEDTLKWLNDICGKYKNTYPIITPRFIPSCSDELMLKLANIVYDNDLPVQSHLSENLSEIEWVKQLCPNSKFYGDAYDQYGLFGTNKDKKIKTIMAHCVYSSDEELNLIKKNNVYIVHCPSSNINVSSGIAPIRKYLDLNLNVGLGSDVAGGTMESMFTAIVKTIEVSKLYWRCVNQDFKALNFKEAFYLATLGGGSFFGKVGTFKEGYEFDAVVIDDNVNKTTLDLSLIERLERSVYLNADILGMKHKFVRGKQLF